MPSRGDIRSVNKIMYKTPRCVHAWLSARLERGSGGPGGPQKPSHTCFGEAGPDAQSHSFCSLTQTWLRFGGKFEIFEGSEIRRFGGLGGPGGLGGHFAGTAPGAPQTPQK